MKNYLKIFSIIILLLLVACDNNDKKEASSLSVSSKEKQMKTEENIEQKNNSQPKKSIKDENIKKTNQKIEKQEKKAVYKLLDNWYLQRINDEGSQKVVLLTIDDAPDQYSLEMAKTLKELDAYAIFFVNGHFLESEEKQNILREIHEMGFMIGNHTYSHAYLPDISEEEQKKEILRVNEMVEEITGSRPLFFRAPNGAYTDYTKEIVEEEQMMLMNWSYGYDFMPEYMTKDALTGIMVDTELLSAGANLLMHDRQWTAAALEDIVKGLRKKGYETIDPFLIQSN